MGVDWPNQGPLEGPELSSTKCKHPSQATCVVQMDFSRNPDRGLYSADITVGVCKQCGHVELYANSHHALCDWLGKRG